MITTDQELEATLDRINHFQAQVRHLRETETDPANSRLSSSGFLAEIEALVTDPDSTLGMSDFGQSTSDQAAYLEAYLSPDSNTLLSRYNRPDINTFRLAFYLHLYDPNLPLHTTFGDVACPPIQEMSWELENLVPYEPPT